MSEVRNQERERKREKERVCVSKRERTLYIHVSLTGAYIILQYVAVCCSVLQCVADQTKASSIATMWHYQN